MEKGWWSGVIQLAESESDCSCLHFQNPWDGRCEHRHQGTQQVILRQCPQERSKASKNRAMGTHSPNEISGCFGSKNMWQKGEILEAQTQRTFAGLSKVILKVTFIERKAFPFHALPLFSILPRCLIRVTELEQWINSQVLECVLIAWPQAELHQESGFVEHHLSSAPTQPSTFFLLRRVVPSWTYSCCDSYSIFFALFYSLQRPGPPLHLSFIPGASVCRRHYSAISIKSMMDYFPKMGRITAFLTQVWISTPS